MNLLNIFSELDYKAIIEGSLTNLIPTIIAGGFALFVIDKMTSYIRISKKMESYGFKGTASKKGFSKTDIKKMCKDTERLDIIFVSGYGFFSANKTPLKKAMDKGMHIRFLCAQVYNHFLTDIENLEVEQKNRKSGTKISEEIREIVNEYESYILDINVVEQYLNKIKQLEQLDIEQGYLENGKDIKKEIEKLCKQLEYYKREKKMEIRYYSTEYRLPFILSQSKPSKGKITTKAWLNITLPPYKSVENFMLTGERVDDINKDEGDFNFIEMMEEHFESIWNKASLTLGENEIKKESQYKNWEELLKSSSERMIKSRQTGNGLLIEVAAQHPLDEGKYPNEEFSKRLDKAIELYNRLNQSGESVYIYVPGSIHKNNEVVDELSLSGAGKNYLVEKGISSAVIYSDEMNVKYKGDQGVYNSTDECYVATQIFEEMKFKQIYCVCSPAQLLRKAFSYIKFGTLPYFEVANAERLHHSYVDEYFKMIPLLLSDDKALQLDSELGEEIRKYRKPMK